MFRIVAPADRTVSRAKSVVTGFRLDAERRLVPICTIVLKQAMQFVFESAAQETCDLLNTYYRVDKNTGWVVEQIPWWSWLTEK